MLILLYKGKSPLSKAIRWRTWSEYSHASIIPNNAYKSHLGLDSMVSYFSYCRVYEAWIDSMIPPRGKVHLRTGISHAHTPGTHIDVFAIENSETIKDGAVRAFLTQQLGKKYDFRGALGFLSRRDGAEEQDSWFCSELVMEAAQIGGVNLLERIEPHRVSPGTLSISPKLRHLGTAITGDRPIFIQASQSPENALHPERAHTPAKKGTNKMQPHTSHLQGGSAHAPTLKTRKILTAANSAPENDLTAANQVTLSHATFEVLQDGLFIPFGDFPHEVGIQRWDAAAANILINELRENPGGQPVYRGHPDVPELKDDWPDKDAKGWIQSATITAHNGKQGVKFIPKYNDDGRDIIEQAKLKFPSPFWKLTILKDAAENGSRIVQPIELVSIGLVNNPNIPVPAVANQAPVKQTGGQPAKKENKVMTREQLIAMLKAAGVSVPADITDEALAALVASTLGASQTAVTEANAATEAAKQGTATATAEAEAEKTNAANARTLAAGAIVDLAITQGKLPQAKRDEQIATFATDFTAANSAMQLLQPILPTDNGKTANLGKRNSEIDDSTLDAANARDEFKSLVEQEKGRLQGTVAAANIQQIAWGNAKRANKSIYDLAYTKA